MKTDFIELFLTCADRAEAEKIANVLLEKHLVAAVNYDRVQGKARWDGELIEGDEVGLRMHSIANNFDRVEAEAAKLHSYETFVLQAIPITHISKDASKWLKENVQ